MVTAPQETDPAACMDCMPAVVMFPFWDFVIRTSLLVNRSLDRAKLLIFCRTARLPALFSDKNVLSRQNFYRKP